MQESARQPEAQSRRRRIYRPKFRWLLILIGILSVVSVGFNLALSIADYTVFNAVSILLPLLTAVFMFLLAQTLRTETSSESLAYHNMGFYTIRASWADVDRVSSISMRLMGEIECIVLSRSTVRGWTGLAWALPKPDRSLTIPLGRSWSNEEDLRDDIHCHAPQAAH